MKIQTIDTGFFKLDGGAMFGVVPKSMWTKLHAPDENNMCTWAMRCLLIQQGDRNILIDTGIGNKQDAKFRSHFHPHGEASLRSSLKARGLRTDQITDVILTHLHFDHCGGAVSKTEDGTLIPTFPNATYWTNQQHLEWARNPNPRERASYLKENFIPLEDAGVLKYIPRDEGFELIPGLRFRWAFGHTEAMLLPVIRKESETLVYCADLIPSSWHVGLPYVMAYDVRPLDTMTEKADLLNWALTENAKLILEHDPYTECITLRKNEKGRIIVDQKGTLQELIRR